MEANLLALSEAMHEARRRDADPCADCRRVGRPDAGVGTADHVLDGFDPEERPVIEEAIGRAADAVMLLLRDGEERAMNEINRVQKTKPETTPSE